MKKIICISICHLSQREITELAIVGVGKSKIRRAGWQVRKSGRVFTLQAGGRIAASEDLSLCTEGLPLIRRGSLTFRRVISFIQNLRIVNINHI